VFAEDLAGAQSAGEVCIDDGVPLVFRKIDRRRAFGAARGIDEDVDLAKRGDRFVQDTLQRRPIGNVDVTRSERRPNSSISRAAVSTCSARREVGTTSAPAWAKPWAMARPIPEVPPQ
jgi:hypothetical protein